MLQKVLFSSIFLCFTSLSTYAQSVGVNTNTPDPSAALHVESLGAKGFLGPKVTATERDAIASPATGLLVFVTDDNTFYFYDGTVWQPLVFGAVGGDNLGDHLMRNNLNLNSYFISGDGDNEGIFVDENGFLGLGNSNPTELLDVTGKTKTQQLQLTNGATTGFVLGSDALGNATWTDPNTLFTDTDDQTLSLTGTDLSIADGNTVDLSGLQDGTGTDDQALSLSGNTLTLEDGGSVDLSAVGVDTDDQTLSLTGTNLSIADGNTVDLSSLQDGTGTDDQALSLSGNTLTLEDGGSVDLSGIDTDTDDQTLSLTGTDLSIVDGNTVDLSGLQDGTGTDDQALSLSGNTLTLEDGGSVDLSAVGGDNLGNHTATENIQTNGNYLSNDGDNEGIFVDGNGNVGIGTNAPEAPLDVAGPIHVRFSPPLVPTANSTIGIGRISTLPTNSSGVHMGWMSNTADVDLSAGTFGFVGRTDVPRGFRFYVGTTPTSALDINTTGQVGIGINNAASIFQVKTNGDVEEGNHNGNVAIFGETDGLNITLDNNEIQARNNGAVSALVINQSGDVRTNTSGGNFGIGTASPSAKLHVTGSVRIQDGTEGLNKVLTSSANGTTSWTDPSTVFTDTDDQTLTLTGNNLSIEDGNSVDLSAVGGDNLGNHTATENIQSNGNWISHDGDDEGIRVSSNGNVGINTNSPSADLHINGITKTNDRFKSLNGTHASGRTQFAMALPSNDDRFQIGLYGDESGSNTGSDYFIRSLADNGSLISIPFYIQRASGNVGIGTTEPTERLDVDGDALLRGGTLSFYRTDGATSPATIAYNTSNQIGINKPVRVLNGLYGNTSFSTLSTSIQIGFGSHTHLTSGSIIDGQTAFNFNTADQSAGNLFQIKNGASEKLTVNHNGNVGVGITNPDAKLDVVDKIKITSSTPELEFNDPEYNINRSGTTLNIASGHVLKLDGNAIDFNNSDASVNFGRWNATGLAIGKTAPTHKLDVNGSIRMTDGNEADGFIMISNANGVASWADPSALGDNLGNHTATENIQTNGNWVSNDGNNEGIFVTETGNVGVGLNNPTQILHTSDDIRVNDVLIGDANLTSNTRVGANSLTANTTGIDNTTVGYYALESNTTGSFNNAFGAQALEANTTGSANVAIGRRALESNTTGGSNIALGSATLGLNETGVGNIAVGVLSLDANTASDYNVAIGSQSLTNTTGSNNVALGHLVMGDNTTGSYNYAAGTIAGFDNTTGSYNTYLGYNTGRGITTGNNNTILGARVNGLSPNIEKSIAIASGDGAIKMFADTDGNIGFGTTTPNEDLEINSDNVALSLNDNDGVAGGLTHTMINFQTAGTTVGGLGIFSSSGTMTLTNRYDGIFFQTGSGGAATTKAVLTNSGKMGIGTLTPSETFEVVGGIYSTHTNEATGIGFKPFSDGNRGGHIGTVANTDFNSSITIDATGNVGIGVTDPDAKLEVNGSVKIVDGTQAIGKVLTSDANGLASWQDAAGGADNLGNHTATQDIVLGTGFGLTDTDGDTKIQVEESADEDKIRFDVEGVERIVLDGAKINIENSGRSVFIGKQAGQLDDLSNNDNAFVGYQAGLYNSSGFSNIAVGYKTLMNNSTGNSNSALGKQAMQGTFSVSTGSHNTAIGNQALYSYRSGNSNTALGSGAMFSTTTGGSNTALGSSALRSNVDGNNNVAIGFDAGFDNQNGSGNIFLGYQAGRAETGSNKLYIENSSSTTPLIYGEFDNDLIRINGNEEVVISTASGAVGSVADAHPVAAFLNNETGTAINRGLQIGAPSAFVGSAPVYLKVQGTGARLAILDQNDDENMTILNSGNIGIGVNDPDAKLEVNGAIKITDGTQGAGKVLTSDANGLASWQDAAGGGGNTLDQAYDQGGAGAGRTITADAGTVTIAGEDGLLVTGTFNTGELPPTGDGVKMFFNPNKIALRAGEAKNGSWDPAKVGFYSTAFGLENEAIGNYTAVLNGINNSVAATSVMGTILSGNGNINNAQYSTILNGAGNTATVNGFYSTIGGGSSHNVSAGYTFIGGGIANNVSGLYGTIAGGQQSVVSGQHGAILGGALNQVINSYASVLGGYNNRANNQYSAVLGGISNNANGIYSSVMGGSSNIAQADLSAVINGAGNRALVYAQTVVGNWNEQFSGGSQTAWVETDPIFTVGNGENSGDRSNAMQILKNGNTEIKGQLTLTDGTSGFTLPNTDGSANQVLTTDGSGSVSWQAPSSPNLNVSTKNSNYTATLNDDLILVDASSANVTITLPSAVGNSGRLIRLKKVDTSSNQMIIDGSGSESIDGLGAQTTNLPYSGYELVSDGSNWFITGRI